MNCGSCFLNSTAASSMFADVKTLYVYSSQTNNRAPLLSVANVEHLLETGRIARREHFRTISILCYPQPGVLASEVIDPRAWQEC
jgi:hypothetical protein